MARRSLGGSSTFPHSATSRRKSVRRGQIGRRLRFEPLEDRQLLAVITVDTLDDENDGGDVGGISLREAIADAEIGDTIEFAVTGTISLIHGELFVDKTLSIVGPGADRLTIDARGESRVFNVDDSNAGAFSAVSIAGLTITGGLTAADGGGILNRENLTVTACHITGNSAEDGGGIGNFSGTFQLVDSTISHNTASGELGGGAGIFNFSGSKAQTSTVSNSTISNNATTSTGSGIYNFLGTIVVEFSTITKNDAPANRGSGIASLGDTNVVATLVHSSIIAGNLDSDVDIVVGFQPTFQSSGYNLIGNGIATGSFMTIGDVRNVANPLLGPLTDNGGPTPTHFPLEGSPAIDTGNDTFAPPPEFDQRRDPFGRVFDGNGDEVARIDKGAVESDAVYFEVDTLADENDADFSAGDFSLREAIGQAAEVTEGGPTIIFAPSLTADGPATIQLTLGQLTIAKPTVIEGPGAALLTIDAQQDSRVFTINDLQDQTPSTMKISGLTLTGGLDANGGGAIFSQERLTVADSVITGNTAQWGGGIYNGEFGILTVLRTRISGNHAIEPVPMALGSGGGLYNWAGTASILDSVITGNDSVTDGGGINNANNGSITIVRSTISDNVATQNGGGINNGDGNVSISSSTINGNRAVRGGGVNVVTPNNRVTTISNSTISGNVAPSGGGGVNNQSGQVRLEFCTITTNVANDFAGSGVLSSPSPTDSPTSIYSSIIAYNFDPNAAPQAQPLDVAVGGAVNSLVSLGFNIVGIGGFRDETFVAEGDQIIDTDDPLLGPLAENGGPTMTHALLAGSPAIDRGDPEATPGQAGVPQFDQRGKPFARVRDGDAAEAIVMDVGAFEAPAPPPELLGDYNEDRTVDAADFVAWRKALGNSVPAYSGADGDGSGIVDLSDHGVWRANFGESLPDEEASGASLSLTVPIIAPGLNQSRVPLAVRGTSESPRLNSVTPRLAPLHSETPASRPPTDAHTHRDAALLAWIASQGRLSNQANKDWHDAVEDKRLGAPNNYWSDSGVLDIAISELGDLL
jgi:hypothetical protein